MTIALFMLGEMRAVGQNVSDFMNSCVTAADAAVNCSAAIGDNAKALGSNSISIGTSSYADNFQATMTFGVGAQVYAEGGMAIHNHAKVSANYGLAIGEFVESNAARAYVFGRGPDSYLTNSTSNSIMFGMNSTVPTLFIGPSPTTTSWGNVGIGTSSPGQLLHLTGVSVSTASPAIRIDKGSSGYGRILIQTGNDSITMAQDNNEHLSLTNWRSDKDIIFNVNDGGTMTEALHIEGSTGNVGVGVNFPNAKLHVEMQDPTDPNLARYSVSGASGSFTFTNSGTTTDMGPTMAGNASVNTLPALLFFARATATDSGTEPIMTFDSRLNTGAVSVRPLFSWENSTTARMTMLANGNLGIGTIAPANRLDVEGSLAVGNTYSGTTSAPTNGAIIEGNVGIGTNAPGFRLDVSGGGLGTTVINSSGDVAGTSFINSSDQMFKTNVDAIPDALSVIEQLQPKSYFFDTINFNGPGKFDFQSVKQYGFIAQQVEETLPELVHTMTKSACIDTLGNVLNAEYQYKALNYIALIPILTKAIQELRFRNDSLLVVVTEASSLNDHYQDQIAQLAANDQQRQSEIQQIMTQLAICCNASGVAFRSGDAVENPQSKHNQDFQLTDNESIVLEQNVPNPFAENTIIHYSIDEKAKQAEILFHNAQGRLIRTVELQGRGNGQLNVFAPDLSSGIYTYTLVIDGQISATRKMVKTK